MPLSSSLMGQHPPQSSGMMIGGSTASGGGGGLMQQQQQAKNDVFVGNLAFNTTEEQLYQIFSEIGRVVKVRMVNDLETGKPRGFAFVEFEDPQAALAAIRNMNEYELNGRPLRVNFSNSSHLESLANKLGMDMSSSNTAASSATMSQIQQQQQQQQQQQLQQHSRKGDGGMESSYGGSTAIADALRGLNKAEIYDILSQFKSIADKDPDEARKLLCAHPQLPEAVLYLMSKLDMIQTPLASSEAFGTTMAAAGVVSATVPTQPPLPPPLSAASTTAQVTLLQTSQVVDPRLRAAAAAPPKDPRMAAAAASMVASTTTSTSSMVDPRSAAHRVVADPRVAAAAAAAAAMDPRTAFAQPPPPPVVIPQQPTMNIPPTAAAAASMTVPPPPLQQPQQQQQPMGGLDPSFIQQVLSLTPQQIAQLPPDKQQSILALRHQLMGGR